MEQELVGVKSRYLALRAIVNKLASEEVIQTGTTHGIGRHSCVMDKVMRWRWKLEEGPREAAFGRTFYRDEVYYLLYVKNNKAKLGVGMIHHFGTAQEVMLD